MRRRIRLIVDLVNGVVRAPARIGRPTAEERSAKEVKRRLDESHSRLKRERPPLEDLDQL